MEAGPSSAGGPEAGVEIRFPPPPMQYVENYSRARLREGRAPPPPPPIQGVYRCFGVEANSEAPILPPLSDLGITALTQPGQDPKAQLHRLNRSIVAAFLDLVEILVRCPDSPARLGKVEDLRLLFINMHHLVNEYRPRQATETLALMLQRQGRETRHAASSLSQRTETLRERIDLALHRLRCPADQPTAS